MNENLSGTKALVTVFEDLETAQAVIHALHEANFPLEKIELVTHDVHSEAPEVRTPKVHETTASSVVDSSLQWSGFGAALGAIAALVTPFPGAGLAMIFMGGLTGAFVGGVAGAQRAVEDDSVNLPTLEEYQQLVNDGRTLVVVLGDHNQVMYAEDVVNELPNVHSHIHAMHGHEFHEHPTS